MKKTTKVVAALVVFAVLATASLMAVVGTGRTHGSQTQTGPKILVARQNADDGNEAVEMMIHQNELLAQKAAPFQSVAPGAYAAAVDARNKAAKKTDNWAPIGNTPLYADSPDYAGSDPVLNAGPSLLGWHNLSGRITALAYDPSTANRIFAAPATGGVWESTDGGTSWKSIGDNLPTGAMGGVGFSTASKGTIIAGTGDRAVGGIFTPSGLGVYRSTNDGKSWTKATGVPDEAVTYKVAIDPTNANVNYVATSKGLYRSTDNGVSYTNVVLPTTCTDLSKVECGFANVVSDVGVQPGTGSVIAAVGWAYGQRKTKSGFVMAPQNGIYTSPTGAPNSFTFQNPGNVSPSTNGFAPTPVVGRTTLSIATGATQDHNIVYALVQDATKLQGCLDPVGDPI